MSSADSVLIQHKPKLILSGTERRMMTWLMRLRSNCLYWVFFQEAVEERRHFQHEDRSPCRLIPADSDVPNVSTVTVLRHIAENLTDRQAADAVRARIDWKYALALEIQDAGFDYSVLSEFRSD